MLKKYPFELPLRYNEISQILPHRYPFLLVDMVTEFEEGKYVKGIKNVSANEPFFNGHFPENPIMPGVLILEALAQMGAVFAKLSPDGATPTDLIVFTGADNVMFRKVVAPGDVLELVVEFRAKKARFWKMLGSAHVNGQRVAQAELKASVLPSE